MQKYMFNEEFDELKELLLNIRTLFSNNGKTIYNIRNHIKILQCGGLTLCIKSFCKPNIVNLLAYSFFRSSKARRSFENANFLLQSGVMTPTPIAYIEYYSAAGVLQNSYYISLYEEHLCTMREVIRESIGHKQEILKQFAVFVYRSLHIQGILHLDFGGNNVLVIQDDHNYKFSLVDLNRIKKTKNITPSQGIENLHRIGGDAVETAMIATCYARERGIDPLQATAKLISKRLRFFTFRMYKHRIRQQFKVLSRFCLK